MRIYPNSAMDDVLGRSHEDDADSEPAYILRATSADRYRELSLYADGRLRMSKEVCPWLGFSLGERTELYAQPFSNGLEVMTMAHRFARLADAETEILPWVFKAPT
jgi:hypothetical protein